MRIWTSVTNCTIRITCSLRRPCYRSVQVVVAIHATTTMSLQLAQLISIYCNFSNSVRCFMVVITSEWRQYLPCFWQKMTNVWLASSTIGFYNANNIYVSTLLKRTKHKAQHFSPMHLQKKTWKTVKLW